jgi:hypothetical protein
MVAYSTEQKILSNSQDQTKILKKLRMKSGEDKSNISTIKRNIIILEMDIYSF